MDSKIIAAYSNDEINRLKSSSGGIFSEIASYVILNKGYVFGAFMEKRDNKIICYHKECTKLEDLEEIRGSKYLPSDLENTYNRIKMLLNDNKLVLFSGTPCQVAGLLSFLGKKYENLITIDFICHGVPSSLVIEKIIKELEIKKEKKVKNINFRDKITGWDNYSFSIEFEDGKIESVIGLKSDFMKLFLSDMYLRNSCYNCQFKGINRESDITLGDFWGVKNFLELPLEEINKGISVLIVHSEKIEEVIKKLEKKITTFPIKSDIFKYNNLYVRKSAIKPINKRIYEKLILTKNVDDIISKYSKETKLHIIQKKVIGKLEKFKNKNGKIPSFKGLPNRKYCYGCMACEKACPFGAIKKEKDNLKFDYPIIDFDKCRKCKKCEVVCPQKNIIYNKD